MSARVLAGRPVAEAIWARVQRRAAGLTAALGRPPRLAVVGAPDALAGPYARQIDRAFARGGLEVAPRVAPAGARATRERLEQLSRDDAIDGVLVLAPLPGGVELPAVLEALDPRKDVDGQHPINLGRLAQRRPTFAPATPLGGLRLLEHYGVPLRGRRAVVVGRSPVVGLPMALLLLAADASVTVCHSRSRELEALTREAEVLCAAAGQPGLLGPRHVRPGAAVVDFGTNPDGDGGLVGDVQTEAVLGVAGAVTPVPGGAGPVTVAVLAEQTTIAAAGEGPP